MKRGIKSVITHEVIDAVFNNPLLVKKFNHPRKDRRIVRRAIMLHALYVEGTA